MEGFKEFIRKQGVVGMAVGITVGVAAAEMVGKIVAALVDPIIALIFGGTDLAEAGLVSLGDGNGDLAFGAVVGALISFLATALAVYLMVRASGADKWDADA